MERVNRPNIGYNIKKLRQLKGLKQEALAIELGISQSEMSEIESLEVIDETIVIRIAQILNLTPEIIREFNEQQAFYSINNKVENSPINDSGHGIHQIFSPIDKVVELYERLLASEKEKLELLKRQINQ